LQQIGFLTQVNQMQAQSIRLKFKVGLKGFKHRRGKQKIC